MITTPLPLKWLDILPPAKVRYYTHPAWSLRRQLEVCSHLKKCPPKGAPRTSELDIGVVGVMSGSASKERVAWIHKCYRSTASHRKLWGCICRVGAAIMMTQNLTSLLACGLLRSSRTITCLLCSLSPCCQFSIKSCQLRYVRDRDRKNHTHTKVADASRRVRSMHRVETE